MLNKETGRTGQCADPQRAAWRRRGTARERRPRRGARWRAHTFSTDRGGPFQGVRRAVRDVTSRLSRADAIGRACNMLGAYKERWWDRGTGRGEGHGYGARQVFKCTAGVRCCDKRRAWDDRPHASTTQPEEMFVRIAIWRGQVSRRGSVMPPNQRAIRPAVWRVWVNVEPHAAVRKPVGPALEKFGGVSR